MRPAFLLLPLISLFALSAFAEERREVVPLYGTVLGVEEGPRSAPPATGIPPRDRPIPTQTRRPGSLPVTATPRRGMDMAAVERQFGVPNNKDPAVGDPPISRWDYDGFSVFFEHQLVLHSVVPASQLDIQHRDQLISTTP